MSPTLRMWQSRLKRLLVPRRLIRVYQVLDSEEIVSLLFMALVIIGFGTFIHTIRARDRLITKTEFAESSECVKSKLLERVNNGHSVNGADMRHAELVCEHTDDAAKQKEEFK